MAFTFIMMFPICSKIEGSLCPPDAGLLSRTADGSAGLSAWHSQSILAVLFQKSPVTNHRSRLKGHGALDSAHRHSLKQIRLLPRDAIPQRLELEPSNQRRSDLRVGELRRFVRNFARLARGFREQLRLTGTVHGDDPPR